MGVGICRLGGVKGAGWQLRCDAGGVSELHWLRCCRVLMLSPGGCSEGI